MEGSGTIALDGVFGNRFGSAMLDGLSDEALMARVGEGSHAAFEILSRRHAPRALALARTFGRGLSDHDDIVQEALLRVWRTAPGWNPAGEARFTTWFHRIVLNLCIDRLRRPASEALDAIPEPPSGADDAPTMISRHETAKLVAAAIKELPERQRAAIALCYFGDRSAAEAAAVLGSTPGAVESLLVRARRALKESLTRLGILDSSVEP